MPRPLPRMPTMAADWATRCLCHAVHLDENLRDYVLHTVVNPHLRAVCPSFGVNLVAVARHAAAARRHAQTLRNAFTACRVIAALAVAVGIVAHSPGLAIGLLAVTALAAFGILAWCLQQGRRRAYDAIMSAAPCQDLAAPLDADTEKRLAAAESANVIVYAEGEGDPFIGSGRLQHYTQLAPVDVTRPATSRAGNKGAVKKFDVVMLHSYLVQEMRALRLPDLTVRNRLYVRGDYAQYITGLLPDPYGSTSSHVDADQVRAAAQQPTARARAYVCVERVREGGQLTVGMYARAELEHDLLSIERSLYFLPPLQSHYQPTRELVANDFASMTLMPAATAARRVAAMLLGHSLSGRDRRDYAAEREREERKARREIQKGFGYDYGARTSLREAAAAYSTHEHFDQSDILRDTKTLDRRLLDLIKRFLDDHGVDTSDLSRNIQQVNTAVTNIQSLQAGTAVVGGQGNLVTGHGAVNNFGARGGPAAGPSGRQGLGGTP